MNTEKEIRDMAFELMNQHGLVAAGWKFDFNRAKTSNGKCKYDVKEISLSPFTCFQRPIDRVRNTILHEIAHALLPGAHHNWRWKIKCREIGCDPSRIDEDNDVELPAGKYVAHCSCRTHHLYRRPKRLDGFRCLRCRETLNFVPTGL
jgi:predicted SprT family Zn-dependent metalloprotease